MFSFIEGFPLILAGLRAIVAQIAFKQRDRTAFLVFVHGRIGRTVQRFERLYARWRNGSLPKPRPPRPASARPPRPAKPQPFRLPRRRAWLLRELQHYIANGRASQFRHLLATAPDLAEFLAAAPQAARLLNPICRMLGASLCVAPGASLCVTPAVSAAPAPAAPEQSPSQPTPPGPSSTSPDPPSHASLAPPAVFSPA